MPSTATFRNATVGGRYRRRETARQPTNIAALTAIATIVTRGLALAGTNFMLDLVTEASGRSSLGSAL
jgi:hypothetical protein